MHSAVWGSGHRKLLYDSADGSSDTSDGNHKRSTCRWVLWRVLNTSRFSVAWWVPEPLDDHGGAHGRFYFIECLRLLSATSFPSSLPDASFKGSKQRSDIVQQAR